MIVPRFVPYNLYGLEVWPGDVLGRIKPGSLVEHEFLVAFYGNIAHSPGPFEFFRSGTLDEVLKDGGKLRVTRPTTSLEESLFRFDRASEIVGVSWWQMNCHQSMAHVVGAPPSAWLE